MPKYTKLNTIFKKIKPRQIDLEATKSFYEIKPVTAKRKNNKRKEN